MSSRRFMVGIFSGLSIVSSLLIGCAVPNKPSQGTADTAAMPTTTAAAPGSPTLDIMPHAPAGGGNIPTTDTDRIAAQAAQRRAEQFVQSLQPAMAKRTQSGGTAQPSQVQWGDPGDFRLSSSPVDSSRDNGTLSGQTIAYKPGSVDAKSGNTMMPPLADGAAIVAPSAASPAPAGKGGATSNAPLSLTETPDSSTTVAPQRAPAISSDLYTLEQRLSARVRDYPRDIAGQLEYQMLMYLMDQPVPQLAPLTPMPSEDRELVAALMDGLSNFRNTVRSDNNMLLSRKIRPILDLADRVRTQADLTIGNVALCTAVRGFGNYDPIEPLRFAAGQEAKFIAYCEVSNFAATLNEKKQWETRLSLELVVYTENGMQVWSPSPASETVNETARARRHDFFLAKKIILPANLAIGRYMLKLTVVDNQVNRVSEATVPIIIGAK